MFRAKDPRLERDVALKVLKQDALHDEDSKRRFRLEARALAQLLHPNIATLFDFDSDGRVDFLVLEFVPGESLAQTLMNGPLPETRARAIALDVTEGLQSAHEKGIVHRDLNPGNIIITPRGRAKVLDFGLARVTPGTASLTQSNSISGPSALVGTVPYMSPEQVRDGRVDASSDLYALGALLVRDDDGEVPIRLRRCALASLPDCPRARTALAGCAPGALGRARDSGGALPRKGTAAQLSRCGRPASRAAW